jgi:hypothetical protein
MEPVSLVARFALATVLVLAAIPKVLAPERFARVIRNYRLAPDRWSHPLARLVPLMELACAALFFLGLQQRVTAAVAAWMMLVFAGAVTVNLLRGRDIECGCLDLTDHGRITWWVVGRDFALAACAAVVLLSPTSVLVIAKTRNADASMSNPDAIALFLATAVFIAATLLPVEARRLHRAATPFRTESRPPT